jgi:Rieske Fe-S protein
MLTRREVVLGGVAVGCLGCEAVKPRPRKLKVGKITEFGEPSQVLELLRIVLKRDDLGFYAMSLICPHQGCLVNRSGELFVCPCHGSNFTSDGKVLNGPAARDLSFYQLSLVDGDLWVDFGATVGSEWRLSSGA